MQQPPWLPVAWADLGQQERPGAATNPRIAAYFRLVGHAGISDDETAWCAAFVGACLETSGLRSTRSLAARSYLAWGVGLETPSFGAIAVLSRGNDPALGHVGFLVGLTDRAVILLGGNQSDAVTVAAFDRSRVLGYRLPSAAAVASPPSRTDGDAGFEGALAHVLAFEGGWSDDPYDPGGATNKGITIAVFARERGLEVTAETAPGLKADLRRIPEAEVRRIYLERYWQQARCPELPAPLAFFHFDAAVNQGVGAAARMLQEALGVAVDGAIGPETLAAARSADAPTVIARYADIRRRRYRALDHFWRFGRGWLRRVDATLAAASAVAAPAPAFLPQPKTDPEPLPMPEPAPVPAPTSSPDARPAKWWGESLTIWGALLTALSTVAPAFLAAYGIDMPPDLVQRFGRDVVNVVQAVAGLAGTVMTIVGRIRATAPLERRAMSLRV